MLVAPINGHTEMWRFKLLARMKHTRSWQRALATRTATSLNSCFAKYATLVSYVVLFVAGIGCSAPKEVALVLERPAVAEYPGTPSATPQGIPSPNAPAVDVGRFDGGKMWTFGDLPFDYFEEAYGMRPDTAWFDRARLSAVRFSNSCSASFVSAQGLVLTNHHCARESITDVSRAGEDLLTNGFYAAMAEEERRVDDLYVDQLVDMVDVTDRITAASRIVRGDNEKVRARANKARDIEKQMTDAVHRKDSTLRVKVVNFYNGGRYAASTFRRYEDVRLVMAPEKSLGYFGGDADNFTFPRYALDMAFFRVYDKAGKPLEAEHYFRWSPSGSRVGDPVFVVGSPGSTNRLGSVAALAYERDLVLPSNIAAVAARADVLERHIGFAEEAGLQNALFSLRNSIKALTGQLSGLRDEDLMARRVAAEHMLRHDIMASDSLKEIYGGIFQDLEELQYSKKSEFQRSEAFTYFGTSADSRILTRALYGYYYDTLKRRGFATEEDLTEVRNEALDLEDLPASVEADLIALRIGEVRNALGNTDPTVVKITAGLAADSVAARIVANSALADSAGFAKILDAGYLGSGDVTVEFISALAPLFFAVQEQDQSFANREGLLNGLMVLARFALYGVAAPPDANSSLRISDGIVGGYAYNGTVVPAYTTYYGLYDHHVSYSEVSDEWSLPERWATPPPSLDLATPLNLVSTNDIAGGNSGSPLLNGDLEIVGLVFDGNIEALPNTYLYTDVAARTVSVDSRGIMEALEHIYGAARIVSELRGE